MQYPLPTAETPEVKRVRALYRVRYRMELSGDEAKDLLERVMHFVYLTEVEDRLDGLASKSSGGDPPNTSPNNSPVTSPVNSPREAPNDALHPVRPQVQ